MSERMVMREHKQEVSCYGKREVVGHDERPIFKVKESYDTTDLSNWKEDKDGNRVRKCAGYKCKVYAYNDESEHGFWCAVCQAKRDKAFRKHKLDNEYKVAISNSILNIAKVARELHPNWNIRKGRGKDTLVYDAEYGDRASRINELRAVAQSFNCKLGNDRSVDNDTCSYNRRQIIVLDDSPFKDVVFDEA